jgi:SAM-dependent methyltransferase
VRIMNKEELDKLRTSYDKVAEEYTRRISDELTHKPLDRQLLDRFADSMRGRGIVCDLGCGPGHVARYLHERQVDVIGIDISRAMVEQARRLNPSIHFQQGDMLSLEVEDGAWAGVVAFYSIINIPRGEVAAALGEIKRALQPGGLLLMSFHIGEGLIHMDEWWEKEVSLEFNFFQVGEVRENLRGAGFVIEEVIERPSYAGVEYASRRAYIFARKA